MSLVSCDLKLLVEGKLAGSIIGKGGSTLRQIKSVSGVHTIQLSQGCIDGDRTVTLTGTEASLGKAHALICQLLRAEAGRSADEGVQRTRLLAPNGVAGMLIGDAGAAIRQLRKASGAEIDVARQSTAGFPKERLIVCKGLAAQMQAAVQLIAAAVAARCAPIRSPQSWYCHAAHGPAPSSRLRERERHSSFLGQWNFDTNFNDHFETPSVAFEDVLPVLRAVAVQARRRMAREGATSEDAASNPLGTRKRRRQEAYLNEASSSSKASDSGDALRELRVYDPYFCRGSMRQALVALGLCSQGEKRAGPSGLGLQGSGFRAWPSGLGLGLGSD